MDLYGILGVKKDATLAEIKKAYRQKSKELHPDKEGGSNEKFADLSQAYEVLSNEEKRKRYDETGHYKKMADPFPSFATSFIMMSLDQCVMMGFQFEYDDFINELKKNVKNGKKNGDREKQSIEGELKKLETIKGRITIHGEEGEDDLVTMVLDSKISDQQAHLKAIEETLGLFDRMGSLIGRYTYRTDERPKGKGGKVTMEFDHSSISVEEILKAFR